MGRKKGSGCLVKRGRLYYLRMKIHGQVKVKALHTANKEEAEVKAKEFESVIAADTKEKVAMYVAEARHLRKAGSVNLPDVWGKFLKTKPNVSAGTLGNHERNWSRFLEWMRTDRPQIDSLGQIDGETAKEYMNCFANTGVHSDTFNKQKLTLSKIWDVLADEAGLKKTDNPFREISSRKDESHSRENLSEPDLMRILQTLDNPPFHIMNAQEVRVMFSLGAFAGMRLADCALLKWKDVMLARGIIAFTPRKTARGTGRPVKIPIHPEIETQLRRALEWRIDDYVLPKTAERYQRNPTGVKNDVIKVFEKCKFKTSETVPGRLHPCSLYGFHSLRHTFVSICANNGVPLAIVQELVGHGNPAITRHYFHGDEKSYREAIKTLPSVPSQPPELPAATELNHDELTKAIIEKVPAADNEILKQVAKLVGVSGF